MNTCNWLPIGKLSKCGRLCKNQYCSYHMQSVRRGSIGQQPCILCGVGVRGKYQLCVPHGGKNYRDRKFYYDTHDNINHRAPVIKSPHDYVNSKNIMSNLNG